MSDYPNAERIGRFIGSVLIHAVPVFILVYGATHLFGFQDAVMVLLMLLWLEVLYDE